MNILENIRELCIRKGVRLEDVAIAAGVNPKSIYRWGEAEPGINKVVAAADYLGVSVDELIGRKVDNKVDPQEQEILFLFHKMNQDGQNAALAMLYGLSMQYKKDTNVQSA